MQNWFICKIKQEEVSDILQFNKDNPNSRHEFDCPKDLVNMPGVPTVALFQPGKPPVLIEERDAKGMQLEIQNNGCGMWKHYFVF